jgi:hypothetical protein
MLLLLCVVALAAIFLMVGCTDGGSQGGSQAEQEDHAPHKKSENVELALRPEHDSGVSGTASLEDTSDGVLVKLNLRNLPKPNTFYLAHIHPGTCAERETHEPGCAHGAEGHGHEHSHEPGGATHEHGAGAKIEYPLSQVRSDSQGQGSSTTTLRQTSVDKPVLGRPQVRQRPQGGGRQPAHPNLRKSEEGGVANRRVGPYSPECVEEGFSELLCRGFSQGGSSDGGAKTAARRSGNAMCSRMALTRALRPVFAVILRVRW